MACVASVFELCGFCGPPDRADKNTEKGCADVLLKEVVEKKMVKKMGANKTGASKKGHRQDTKNAKKERRKQKKERHKQKKEEKEKSDKRHQRLLKGSQNMTVLAQNAFGLLEHLAQHGKKRGLKYDSACAECVWIKHRKKWQAQDESLKKFVWGEKGVGCTVCHEYHRAHPEKAGTMFSKSEVGCYAPLKKDLLVRHFSNCDFHRTAVKWADCCCVAAATKAGASTFFRDSSGNSLLQLDSRIEGRTQHPKHTNNWRHPGIMHRARGCHVFLHHARGALFQGGASDWANFN